MSKTPPGETEPEEAVDIDIADLSTRLSMLEKSQIPIFVGTAIPYLGATIGSLTSGEQEIKPSFLLANGASVGRTKWPQLFNEYGTKYGSVDSATFTLPNMLGRVLVPRNVSGLFNVAAGVSGGQESHTHLHPHTHDLSNHTHTVSTSHQHDMGGHTHTFSDSSQTGTSSDAGGATQSGTGASRQLQAHDHAVTVSGTTSGPSTSVTGSGGAGVGTSAPSPNATGAVAGAVPTDASAAGAALPPYIVIEGWLIYAGVQAL